MREFAWPSVAFDNGNVLQLIDTLKGNVCIPQINLFDIVQLRFQIQQISDGHSIFDLLIQSICVLKKINDQ